MRKILLLLWAGLLFLCGQALAQSRTVTGKITDESGSPIPNASILVKGTQIGTTSGADGSFSLTVPDNAKSLIISSIDYDVQDLPINGRTSITVSLVRKNAALEEVIVSVPYGTVKKTAFTGSEVTVSARSIERQQVTNVTRVLEGLVPGVVATNGGGMPGSGADIRIRGIGSVNASSSPLYVVNGVPYDGSISAISNDDIETVTVLKDAAAAALYGSRAANGVIMITTKRGRKGKTVVNGVVRQGFLSRGIPEYDRVGVKDYYELNWESIRNSFMASGQSAAVAGANATAQLTDGSHLVYNAYDVDGNKLVDPVTGKLDPNAKLLWTDSWEDALFRTANRTNATVSVAGGGDRSDYYLALGYLGEEGTLKFTDYKRYNFRLNVNSSPTDWFNTGLNIDGALADNNNVLNSGSFTSNPFYYTRNMGPIYPVYQYDRTGKVVLDVDGNPALDWGRPAQMGTRPYAGNSNLLGSLDLDERGTKRINANANTYAEVKFLKNFSLKTTFGVNILDDVNTTYQNNEFGDAANVAGRSTKENERQISYTLNEVLSWTKEFGSHNIRALAGHENYYFRINNLNLTRTGFLIPGTSELDNAETTESVGGSFEDNHRIESYFANVNYAFNDKYLASVSYRTDGTSRFSDDVRWGNFYSAGIGWRLSQESFLSGVRWINELKLKASYGEQGNENILDANANPIYYAYGKYYSADGEGGYKGIDRFPNSELQWEGNKTFNVGFDFSIFSNRMQGTIEYFDKTSDGLLFDVPYSPSLGAFARYENIGTLKNTGIELQLGYNAIRSKDFDWRVDLNLTHFKNEITKLPPRSVENGIIVGTKKLMEGRSVYDFWLREFAGVDASTGEALYYRDVLGADGKPTGERTLTNNIANGSFYYNGSAIPDIIGGLTNSFRYKNFDLSFLLTFSYGSMFYDGNYSGIMHSGTYGTAWHSDILNRWQKPGDVTNVPKVQQSRAAQQDGQSDRFLFDGSYLNIKNISLSYNVPANVTSRMHITGLQIFGNIDNAHLFTAKKGMDPQRAFTGVADAVFPPYRTLTFGLNVKL